jgi:cytochrome b561
MEGYSVLRRRLHWITVVLVAGIIPVGFVLGSLPDGVKQPVGLAHAATGITIGLIALTRLALHLRHGRPEYPAGVDAVSQRLSGFVQRAMMTLLILQPVVGIIFFRTAPAPGEPESALHQQMYEVHELVAYCLLGLIVLHVVGTVRHRMAGVNLLERIGWR